MKLGKTKLTMLVVGLLIVAGVAVYFSLNDYQHDGELRLAGLEAPVRVIRDEKGMPYIYAENHHDATMAQGFISAQDRLFQMELVRRSVAGRLAEIFGEALRDRDIEMRTIGIYRAARKHYELLDEDDQRYLQSYVDGINAYIRTREEELPLKIALTGMKLELWTPVDSLAIFYLIGWSGSANLHTEIIAQSLVDQLGYERAREIFPLNINPDEGSLAVEASNFQGQKSQQLGLTTDLLFETLVQGQALRLGSNNWAVASRFSPNGLPIVAGDPHLDARTLPGPIYPMGIFTPQYRVVGASVAGMPALVISRNQYVATAITNGYGDTQDLYIETLDPENPDHYLEGDVSLPFDIVEQSLKIKDKSAPQGYRTESFKMKFTRRGPLVSGIIRGLAMDKVLSLRWSMAEGMRPTLGLDGFLFAKSTADVKATLKNWTMISGNWVFADTQGNIGFHASARIPIRSSGESILPWEVTDDSDNWIGWIPFDEMPHSYNPSRGWVGSANHKVVMAEYPYYYSSYFAHSYRYQRLRELLDTPGIKSTDDHWQIQRDTRNMMAVTLAPIMSKALLTHADTEEMGKILSAWNHRDDIDLAGPAVFHSVFHEFAKLVFEDELGEELSGQMLNASARLEPELGSQPERWQWGDIHQIEFTSPLRRRGAGKTLLGAGKYPFPGSGETLHRGIYAFSGRLFDSHRDDQIKSFIGGEKRYWWFSDKLIQQHAQSQLNLVP